MNKSAGQRKFSLSSEHGPRRAFRLLQLLVEPRAYAIEDQTEAGIIAVRQTCRGVSIGSGSFPVTVLDDLIRRDLVERRLCPSGRPTYQISEAGTAHLRRQAAAADDRFL